jgi:serine/threonine protein kinase
MTMVSGASLISVYKGMKQPVSAGLCRFIVAQTALLLKELHEQGILYRDLKISNIVVDSLGRVGLVDFGLSKRIGKTRLANVTKEQRAFVGLCTACLKRFLTKRATPTPWTTTRWESSPSNCWLGSR